MSFEFWRQLRFVPTSFYALDALISTRRPNLSSVEILSSLSRYGPSAGDKYGLNNPVVRTENTEIGILAIQFGILFFRATGRFFQELFSVSSRS
jgi:hypothetical protein